MAVLTPGRSCGLNDLLRGLRLQIFAWRAETQIRLVCCLPNKFFKEAGSFKPPMPKQFGIEWSYNDWIESQFADFANLLAALFQKVTGMFRRRIFRRHAVIQLFLITASGDPMIFHAGEFSAPASDWSQMFLGKIETDVAIKFPVNWIARITFVRAPNLPTCVRVPRKRRRPSRRITRGINRAARLRFSK